MAFRLHYGSLWTDKIPEAQQSKEAFKRLWRYSLKCLSSEKVQYGINQIVTGETEFSTFPPNPAEFVELCRSKMPAVPEFKALPRPKADKQIAGSCLAEMKKKLGMRTNAN